MMSPSIERNHKHDHDTCIQEALQNAKQICQVKGGVLTDIRRQVLELIWRNHHPVKAYDIIEKFKPSERTQGAAKPTTIYRALEFLLEKGLIHRVESLNAFIGCSNPLHVHELILLICKKCENVQEINAFYKENVKACNKEQTASLISACAEAKKKFFEKWRLAGSR
jgi:Fur family zinc uptake transcriptional regulator